MPLPNLEESWTGTDAAAQDVLACARALALSGRSLAAAHALPSTLSSPAEAAEAAALRSTAAECKSALAELELRSSPALPWHTALENSELQVLYHHAAGSQMHSIACSGTVPAPARDVLAIAREFDLVQTWQRFVTDTIVLATAGLFQVDVYASVWTPPPLCHRDFSVRIVGHDLLAEENAILLLFRSADADAAASPLLPRAAASRVRMAFHKAAIKLVPLPGGETRGTLVAHVDPRMPGGLSPPEWAVSWALRVLMPYLFAACKRVAASVAASDVYQKRMAANAALYGLVAEREAAARARLAREECAPAAADARGEAGTAAAVACA
jgi:hypothetical protein